LKSVFARLGIPKGVRSDNGPCFTSETFRLFYTDPRWKFNFYTSSPRYPQSNGQAEQAVRTVKGMWSKDPDRDGALLAYRDTPLQFGFSPAELLYGRQIGTSLGFRPRLPVDFKAFEEIAIQQAYDRRRKWNRKHRAKPLAKLDPGQKVWIKAPSDVGREGLVLKYDAFPNSVLVQSGGGVYAATGNISSPCRTNLMHALSPLQEMTPIRL